MLETQDDFPFPHLHALIERPRIFNFLPIGDSLCGQREPRADRLFPFRMNVIPLAHIGDHSHPNVRQRFGRQQLRFPQLRPITLPGFFRDCFQRALLALIVRRQLHGQKSKIPLLPILPPVSDQVGEQFAILMRASGVRLALVPDGAFDREPG